MSKKSLEEVVDASYVLNLLLPDEKAHLDIPEKMVAPALLKNEIMNGLRTAVVRKRISIELARKLLGEFETWSIRYVDVDLLAVLNLSIEKQISGYDANYLWLGKKLNLKLRTFDKQLLAAISA